MEEFNPAKKLESFFSKFPSARFNKGEVITRPLSNKNDIYYISEGFVKMYMYFYEGKEFTLNIFKPQSYFSVTSLLSGLPDHNYYQALSPVKIHYIPQKEVIQFLKNNQDVLFELTKRLSVGFQSFINNFSCIINGTAIERVSTILLILSKRFGKELPGGKTGITIHMIHQDIASMANLSRETTSIELKYLENENVIKYKGGYFTVIDHNRLVELTNNPDLNNDNGELKGI